MALADFIESNMEELVAEWKEFAQTRLPAAEAMDPEALSNGSKEILRAIAADIASPQSDQDQKEKSRGLRRERGSALSETAREHAAHRLAAGFTLDQLVSEYRALRATVVRRWTEDMTSADREMLDELVRFNEAIDESLTEAIRWFHRGLERSRDVFIGILGHDLRDPLNTAMAATALQLASDDPEAQRKAAEMINKSLGSMVTMIDDLLDLTRTRLGERLPLSPQHADLRDVCIQVVESFELSHREHEVRLQCRGDLTGTFDPERIHQALANLLKNALQHGRRAAPVTVVARGEADAVALAVHNEGPLIPADKLCVIFDPLTRGDVPKPISGKSENLGLGLYIVRQIVEGHGGTVEVESTATAGTAFTLRLPRQPVDA